MARRTTSDQAAFGSWCSHQAGIELHHELRPAFHELLAIPDAERPHTTQSYLRMHETVIGTLAEAGLAKDNWDVFGTRVIGSRQRRDPPTERNDETAVPVRYPPLSAREQLADAERRFAVLMGTSIRDLPAKA